VGAIDAIAKLDVILLAVMLLEGWAIYWLTPLGESPPNGGIWRLHFGPLPGIQALPDGTRRHHFRRFRSLRRFRSGPSPDGIRRQRLGRFLLPLLLLVFVLGGLFIFFGPHVNPSPGTRGFEYVAVALTPGYVAFVVQGTGAMVRAGRQRRQRLRALRQLHRRRQSMPS
jgi:hypothetical protein